LQILDEENKVDFSIYYGEKPVPSLLIMQKTISEAVGHEDFVADNDGAYSICVAQNMDSVEHEGHPVRFKLTINYGYDNEYYEKLGKEQNFDLLNLEVHKLNDMMTMTLNEADYQKHKEVSKRESEKCGKVGFASSWVGALLSSVCL